MYQHILFDLDGTLTDSGTGIMHSIIYAMEKLSWPIPDEAALRSFIGPPLLESFSSYTENPAVAQEAVQYYREYYQKKGMFENRLYTGIPEVLMRLQQSGAHLYIATSKPEKFAKQILAHFQLSSYFTGIYGASLDGQRSKKGDVIRYALETAFIPAEKATTVMIGDRSHDILGARENHLSSIGVLYGFGERQELQTAGAGRLVQRPLELLSLLLT